MTSIEEHKDAVGFVPQDDTVYAELTVKENLIYSGKFRLERGTDILDIEDYADATLAKLGLTRVANTIVGDVTRRGVSGGEVRCDEGNLYFAVLRRFNSYAYPLSVTFSEKACEHWNRADGAAFGYLS